MQFYNSEFHFSPLVFVVFLYIYVYTKGRGYYIIYISLPGNIIYIIFYSLDKCVVVELHSRASRRRLESYIYILWNLFIHHAGWRSPSVSSTLPNRKSFEYQPIFTQKIITCLYSVHLFLYPYSTPTHGEYLC